MRGWAVVMRVTRDGCSVSMATEPPTVSEREKEQKWPLSLWVSAVLSESQIRINVKYVCALTYFGKRELLILVLTNTQISLCKMLMCKYFMCWT